MTVITEQEFVELMRNPDLSVDKTVLQQQPKSPPNPAKSKKRAGNGKSSIQLPTKSNKDKPRDSGRLQCPFATLQQVSSGLEAKRLVIAFDHLPPRELYPNRLRQLH